MLYLLITINLSNSRTYKQTKNQLQVWLITPIYMHMILDYLFIFFFLLYIYFGQQGNRL